MGAHEYSKEDVIDKEYTRELTRGNPHIMTNIEGRIIKEFEGPQYHKMKELTTK